MRGNWERWARVACLAWIATTGFAAGVEAGTTSGTAPADVVAVERRPFEAVLELKGTFEPLAAVVVDGRAESSPQPLEIVRVVPHGSRVAEGDVILQLDADRIDRAIADLEVDLAVGEKELEIARRDLAAAEKSLPLDLADAEREDRTAAEDLDRFTVVGRKAAEEAAAFGVRAAEQRLRSAREELAQLEKMYADKDLTEETEEMILERTRFDVASAEQFLRQTRIASEDALTLDLPRRAVDLQRAVDRAALSLAKARATLALQVEQKRRGLAKLEHERSQGLRKLDDLRHDRGLATLRAPREGILYHGRLQGGAWATAAVTAKAVVGQAVAPGELSFTVCDAVPGRFRARVDEPQLHLITAGLKGVVTPTGYPDARAAVTLEPVFVPVPSDGRYDAAFAATMPEGGPVIHPGMTGMARFILRSRPDALTVPEAAVSREGDGASIVYVVRDGEQPEKRRVRAGLTSAGRTEILEGLAAGDRVRTSKP